MSYFYSFFFFCQKFWTISFSCFGFFTSGANHLILCSASPSLTPTNFMYSTTTINLVLGSNLSILLYTYSLSLRCTCVQTLSVWPLWHLTCIDCPSDLLFHYPVRPDHPREKLHILISASSLLHPFTLCWWNKGDLTLFVLRKSKLAVCHHVPSVKGLIAFIHLVSSVS